VGVSGAVIEPTRVWSRAEWREEHPWRDMPKGELRAYFKGEAFSILYGADPERFREKFTYVQA
jgi:hypothetical protein